MKIEDDNSKSAEDRFDRLKFFFNIATKEETPFPGVLVLNCYEDAKRCWYDGSFVPTIVMSKLAFETLLHHHYLLTQDAQIESLETTLADATFDDLIESALPDGYVTQGEAKKIHYVDEMYNAYVRPKDQTSESIQEMKVKLADPKIHGGILKKNAEAEARDAIQILTDILPDICKRNGGL